MANPGYREISDVPYGMECRCRSKMGSVLALLLRCLPAISVESGYGQCRRNTMGYTKRLTMVLLSPFCFKRMQAEIETCHTGASRTTYGYHRALPYFGLLYETH